jgi:hypothetical protein
MDILYSSLHQIDHYNERVVDVDIARTSADLGTYIERLLTEIVDNSNNRKFRFGSNTTEVRATIDMYLGDRCVEASLINANRLLRIEQQAQEGISRPSIEIQRGSLFQAFIEDDGFKKVIISKADHSEFLDETDFMLHTGLPWKKKVFKAVIIEINNQSLISNVYVYDTNRSLSKYWWSDFLELSEVYTDSQNTKTVLDLLDKKIFDPMKRISPADHTYLRNSSIKYFRSRTDFVLEEYIEEVFNNYTPVNTEFNPERYIDKVKNLPERWGFDPTFTIVKEDINKRTLKENKISLTEKIDLVINDYVEDLKSTIKSSKEIDGKKFIKIYTETGYEYFKDNES